jgi:hypothetical protein
MGREAAALGAANQKETKMTTTMNRPARRRARGKKRKLHRMPDGRKVKITETINLSDPNLDPEHRDLFIEAVRGKVAQLDELVANWYRHRGECNIEGCDCGGNALTEEVETMCSHLLFIKQRFGELLIGSYPAFGRLVKDQAVEPGAYELLASHGAQ